MNAHPNPERIHFCTALQFCTLCLTVAGISIVKETIDPEVLTFRSVTLGIIIISFIAALYHSYKGMGLINNQRDLLFHHNPIAEGLPNQPYIASINSPAA